MSLFRKPKRIQRRVFCVDDDDDGEPEPPPPPVISHGKKENKPAKSTPLLSFADEEDDGEVFIVKKSSQSKRLAKRRDREKRRAIDIDNSKFDNHTNNEERESPVIADKQEKSKAIKKKASLEGLILSGREALAADGVGDVSGSEEEAGAEEDDDRGFHRYRAESVRAALAEAPGHIPDAALIHAARKTRQQAREHGEVVPGAEAAPGPRLQRDDGSGDDEEEGRLHVRGLDMPNDKPKRGTAAALADSELDSEGEEWAAQQLHKARVALADPAEGAEMQLNPFAVAPPPPRLQEAPAHLRPLAEPSCPHPSTPQALLDALTERLQELEADRESTLAKKESWQGRLAAAAATQQERAARTGALDAAYRRAQAARGFLTDLIECLDEKLPALEALEARALALHRRRCALLTERRRADVQDQALDTLASGRAGKAVDSEDKIRRTAEREGRRRARRLKREAAAAAAGAPPPRSHRDGDSSDDDLPPSEEHYYRQEKESIRTAAAGVFADALPAWRSARGVCARLARWRRLDPALYADAYVPDCLPKLLAPYVRHQLILWNPLADEDNEDYERMDWYKWLMMYGVRNEKLSSESEQSSEEEGSGGGGGGAVSEAGVRADPDLLLVPAVVCGVVLPKLAELVESAWDPVCVRACVRLRQLLVRVCALPGAAPAAARVAAAARACLQRALHADVFLPPLPLNHTSTFAEAHTDCFSAIIRKRCASLLNRSRGSANSILSTLAHRWDSPLLQRYVQLHAPVLVVPVPRSLEGGHGAFWRRCLGAGVRLLRAALALTAPPPLLRADDVALALIETLSTGAGACAGPAAAAAAAALAETLPRGAGELRARALRRLARLAALALHRLDQANPLHMKAVEQAKAVIAEARTVE